ncbi:beta-1,4-galactosyltransferase 5-like [Lytechinus pictus]|uniref:beta-1,4-galactosyltransferase 5-like n=1 Tax=Lytechinus pictus TaxID=7653 RepID=UPI0030B9DF45
MTSQASEQSRVKGTGNTLPSRSESYSIPSDERLTPDKEASTVQKVNEGLFGKFLPRTQTLVDMANRTLPSIILKRKSIREAADEIDKTITELNLAVDIDDYRLLPGGHWIPLSCNPRWKVAIVVPFRNRFHHLPIFLRHIVPLLKRQKLEFSIFIAEQRNDERFNRAMLMNVGFVEALNFTNYDCVVFHDIDQLAINVKNYFGCDNMPRHFISGEAIWEWKLYYEDLFGGVTGLTKQQFYDINGLPNIYWGWGGEDDEFANRVKAKDLKRSRPKGEIGYFDSIVHERNESSPFNEARFCLLGNIGQRRTTDGVSNLRYEQPTIELHPLYTNISVNIQKLPWNPRWKRC